MTSYGFKRSVEVLKEAVPLVDFAGELTELRKAGSGFVGSCPLPDHEDKTPSFCVYPDQHYHCFGCEAHGDVLDLFMAVEGIPGDQAGTALAELAHERGVELPGRSDRWHEASSRKAEIGNLALRVRGQVYKRRAFRLLVLPAIDGCYEAGSAEHERETRRAWREFGAPHFWARVVGHMLGGT